MNDQLVTHHGELVAAHVGPLHMERTDHGVELTLVGSVNPTVNLTVAEARSVAIALATAR